MAKKLIVFLHGFGFDKNENKASIEKIVKAFPNYDFLGIDAPFPSERERGGYAWFSITNTRPRKYLFDDGKLDYSLQFLQKRINEALEQKKLSWKDLILIGRSQGSFLSILLSSQNVIPCYAVICLGSRFNDVKQFKLNSFPPIFWFEMEKEEAPREKLDVYKDLISKGLNLKYLIGKASDHNFISPETTDEIIKQIQSLDKRN
ncbi:MAG: hypothetical protein JW812_03010 [Alphaproteobacteria bacterium]|nr:hypothetical protein [Alphaproteobacteria bacterium]MBN2779723.1 hypothetical protein [Alphaproteobacteria bacterium]